MNKTVRTHTDGWLLSPLFNLLLEPGPCLAKLLRQQGHRTGLSVQLIVQLFDDFIPCSDIFNVFGKQMVHLVLKQSTFFLLFGETRLKLCNLRYQVFFQFYLVCKGKAFSMGEKVTFFALNLPESVLLPVMVSWNVSPAYCNVSGILMDKQ